MNRIFIVAASLLIFGMAEPSFGQYGEQRRLSSFSGGRFYNSFTSRGSILGGSNVSPYLALTDFSGTGVIDPSRNYFTQVRPRLENQDRQRLQQRNISNLERNVASINSAVARANSQQYARSTGHPTRFATYLQYYPGLSR